MEIKFNNVENGEIFLFVSVLNIGTCVGVRVPGVQT